MEQTPLHVSDAVALINQTLDYAFPTLVVEGEVASFKVNQGKFVFFDIKDNECSLGCFMMLFSLRTPLEDGMRVQVVATPKLTAWGKFSLTVREVRPVGEGSLKRAFELLRKKLETEGLFAPERKRTLPFMPSKIGVISSTDAAGYKDFIKIVNSRWGAVDIQVAHVQVQGAAAPEQMVSALRYFNEQAEPVEVVVIVRGGGSADDLSAFNDEPLVRAIAASRIPTLVGVGHEVDVTLADMAADVRAATPSEAAQIVVPDKREIERAVNASVKQVLRVIDAHVQQRVERVFGAKQTAFERIVTVFEVVQRQYRMQRNLIRQLDPKTVLMRGYALVYASDNTVLGKKSPKKGDVLRVETRYHNIEAEVHHVRQKTE